MYTKKKYCKTRARSWKKRVWGTVKQNQQKHYERSKINTMEPSHSLARLQKGF